MMTNLLLFKIFQFAKDGPRHAMRNMGICVSKQYKTVDGISREVPPWPSVVDIAKSRRNIENPPDTRASHIVLHAVRAMPTENAGKLSLGLDSIGGA